MSELIDLKIRKEKPKKTSGLKLIVIFLFFTALVVGGVVIAKKSKGLFNPISVVGSITDPNLKNSDGRTNLLLLGVDNRSSGPIQNSLTDSILVVSIGSVDHDVVLISLPRDLWVEGPGGYKSKINEVYGYGQTTGNKGGQDIMKVVSDVLGMPIHYYSVIDFNLFKDAINILGGVEVNVNKTFTDYQYPIEGKENDPNPYQTVEFKQGVQTMDGETALKYVRSRHGNNGEDTDFARSERQQKIIAAIKTKILSLNTLLNPGKVKDLYDLYSKKVDTNITFTDVQNFYLLSQQINFDKITSIVLDDRSAADEGGLLYHPDDTKLYNDAWVLVPKAGDFSQLHAYVQRYLFGGK